MNKARGQASRIKNSKANRWRSVVTVLPVVAFVGAGSAVSSGALLSSQQAGETGSNFLSESLEDDHKIQNCPSGLAQNKDVPRSGSAAVADMAPSIDARGEDASSRLPRKIQPDGPLMCLALNIYWEARNQNVAGQLAVAQVTMNRYYDPRYPDDVCEVVYDHKQFSWYWDGLPDRPKDKRSWDRAVMIASAAMAGSGHAELQSVTHYHAVYSKPYWKDYMTKVAMIGDHVFYAD